MGADWATTYEASGSSRRLAGHRRALPLLREVP